MPQTPSDPTKFSQYPNFAVPKWRNSPAAQQKTRNFTIDYQHIDPATAQSVLEQAEAALADVTNALKDFDRANTGKTIAIFVRDHIGPDNFPSASSEECKITIPARFLMPQGAHTGPAALRGRGPTLWNNIVNVCFPPKLKDPGPGESKFYCEGLGGYMQATLAKPNDKWPPASYPTMGQPLDEAVASMMAQYGALPKDGCHRHIQGTAHSPERRLAWLQAASYVQYLMKKNEPGFAAYYCGRASFSERFGEPDLWQEWIEACEAYASNNFELPPT